MQEQVTKITLPISFFKHYITVSNKLFSFGEYVIPDGFTVGLYSLGFAQATYNTWPFLTKNMLSSIMVHEESHHQLTLATSLGHLQLHMHRLYSILPKNPPGNTIARLLNSYINITTHSSQFVQETFATINAYAFIATILGRKDADNYLSLHVKDGLPESNKYHKYVLQAIEMLHSAENT